MGFIFYFGAAVDGWKMVSRKGIPEATKRNFGGGQPRGNREELRGVEG